MKEYRIYMEGFACTGESGSARYVGVAKGYSFEDACANFYKGNSTYNKETNSFWGCRLYNSMGEAMKAFG